MFCVSLLIRINNFPSLGNFAPTLPLEPLQATVGKLMVQTCHKVEKSYNLPVDFQLFADSTWTTAFTVASLAHRTQNVKFCVLLLIRANHSWAGRLQKKASSWKVVVQDLVVAVFPLLNKGRHAELVSASTACIICYRWPLLTVMATTQLVDSESSSQWPYVISRHSAGSSARKTLLLDAKTTSPWRFILKESIFFLCRFRAGKI